MTQVQEPLTRSPANCGRWAGRAGFGALLLCIAGSVIVMQGLVALLDEASLIIAFDAPVIFALTARWAEVGRGLG